MRKAQELRVGHIPYLNCVPFFHNLRACGFCGEIVSGVPSALNRMLQAGEIDLSPSSSFEYMLNSEKYLLLPDHAIASSGPVKSVLLFSPCPLEQLENRRIAITGESATSINLLRVLLLEYVGLRQLDDYIPQASVESLVAGKEPALLIGDRAMQQAEHLPATMLCYDLGALWYQFTGLPFVFALWILRRDSAAKHAEAVSALQEQLTRSLCRGLEDLPALAEENNAVGAAADRLVQYWRTIDYQLSARHLEGLDLFTRLCQKHGLLKTAPRIEFFRPR